jgi:hypothetical protein
MLTRLLRIALVVALSLEVQVAVRAQASSSGESSMLRPPPVSDESYHTEAGLEERSNFISGSIEAGVGYIDNLDPGNAGKLSEKIISLRPGIAFDTKSAREHMSVSYNPSFLFYEPSSDLNESDQDGVFRFEYRFSPRFNMNLSDMLLRSSTGFAQIGSGGISGSTQATTPGIILPFGTRFSNDATGGLSYQISPHSMVGGSGSVGTLNFSNSSQTAGLYNSNSYGGRGFYNYRLSASQYLGGIYEFDQTVTDSTSTPSAVPIANPAPTGQYKTQAHTIDGFYTIYVTKAFSLSVAGGPQHYHGEVAPTPATNAWTPAILASMGWQNPHTSFAAAYSRTVNGGEGLFGAFHSTSANATGRWQISRRWNAGLAVNYTINKSAAPVLGLTSPGGHTFATSLSLGRNLSPHTNATLRYDRIENQYGSIPSVATNPSSDRIMLSITWQFQRPIGR